MSKPKIFVIGLAALVLLGAGVLYGIGAFPVHAKATSPAQLVSQPTPKAAPAVAFTDPAGVRHALTAYKGRYVLLNLWATWCAPCVSELPALAKLKGAAPGITVLAVDVGRDTAPAADAFLKSHKAADLGTYVDSDIALIRAFGAYGLPVTVLIDPNGNVVGRAEGPAEWAAPATIDYFKSLTTS